MNTFHFIDRRKNPKGKSLGNRQRFLKRARAQIKDAVNKSLRDRSMKEIDKGEKITIPSKSTAEPRFSHDREKGAREAVHPGNKEFSAGDKIKKPPKGAGRGKGRHCGVGRGRGREGDGDAAAGGIGGALAASLVIVHRGVVNPQAAGVADLDDLLQARVEPHEAAAVRAHIAVDLQHCYSDTSNWIAGVRWAPPNRWVFLNAVINSDRDSMKMRTTRVL